MKNFGKIISDKDIITKEYLDSKGYISAITSKMVTDALGFTPFDSAAFTKASIKNALGIADWALAASKPSYDDVYLKLSGGTINGVLSLTNELRGRPLANPANENVISQWRFISAGDTVYLQAGTANGNTNGNLAFSGYSGLAAEDIYFNAKSSRFNGSWSVQTSLASVSLLSNIFDVNASLKVQSGWNLYLNGEAIMKWSDLKSKIAYSFSEISSKPTTLSGYGITDAVKFGGYFTPDATSPTIGFATTANGWPYQGAALMIGSTGSGQLRLISTMGNSYMPEIFVSGRYLDDESEWARIITDKNIGSNAIAIESNGDTLLPTDLKAKAAYVYGRNGWKVAGPAMIFPHGGYSGLFNFRMYNPASSSNDYPSLFININYNGTLGPWTEVITDKNIAKSTGLDSRYLKLTGGTIDGSLTINGQLVGQAISNPINANVTNKWRFIYANNGIYLQAGTSDGNTAGNLYFSGYTGVAANKITFTGLTSEFTGNATIKGSLTITGNGITLGGRTISNWDQVKMEAAQLTATTGSQSLSPNMHYTFSNALTSSSNISITLTDNTSGESITKIYYIVFRTGATTPTFTFNRTLYWKDGKSLTTLAANKRYRIVIDNNLATLETYS